METKTKKTAIDLTEIAIGIVILGVIVSIGATVLINLRNTQITNTATYSVNAETVTPTDAGVGLTTTWGSSVDYCLNGTAGPTIASANYTYSINSENGVVTLTNATSEFAYTSWACNYTVYNVSDPRYALPNNASIGLAEYGNWFKIIVIVGVAAVVLGLIFMAFGNRSGFSGSGSSQGY